MTYSKVALLSIPTSGVTKATEEDDAKLLRVLKYLRGTADIGLGYSGDSSESSR